MYVMFFFLNNITMLIYKSNIIRKICDDKVIFALKIIRANFKEKYMLEAITQVYLYEKVLEINKLF